ncbi:MAG: phage tail protein [Desulfobacterales bacterium]|nr:phage tail protein [Desulfobacterales bacterium]
MPQLASIVAPMLAKAIFGFAISSIGRALMPSMEPDGMPDTSQLGFQANVRSTKMPLPLNYGITRPGCNHWYVGSSGDDNKYLHMICVLGEGEIDSIVREGGVDQVFLDNRLHTEYGGKVYYELFNGSATQNVCQTLKNAVPEWKDPLRNTAYLYVRLEFDRNYFQAIPNITVKIKGLKVLDPATGIRAWSDNPALCVHDYLTRRSVRGGWGISGSRVNIESIEAARQYCADKGWTCNMPVKDNHPVADNMEQLLANFRGDLIYSGSKFTLKYRDLNDEAVVMSFDETGIEDGSFTTRQPDLFSLPNAVRVYYLAEEGADDGTSTYKRKSYPLSFKEVVAEDGDYREQTYECLGLGKLDKVQEMAYYLYERARANKPFAFTAGQDAVRLEPCDLIQLTHARPGWVNKVGRVESVRMGEDFSVAVTCIEEHLGFYDQVVDPAAHTWYETTLPSFLDEPEAVINVSHFEEMYTVRGRSFTRWKIEFDLPDKAVDPFVEYADVELKIGSGEYEFKTRSEGGYTVDPVEEGETYYLRLRTVRFDGRRQPLNNATIVSRSIVGLDSSPTDLFSMTAAANGDSISIFANPVPDSDIDGYEVRLGDAWDGAIFISYNKNCSLRLNGVRPGTHTFWMSPRDNAGKYSANPVSATCKVFRPPGYTRLPTYGSWAWDFRAGTFSNTEYTTVGGRPALRCSHTGDVLTGTWTSPKMDLNAVEDVRIWGDFLTVFKSSSTSWAGVAPAGVSWNDLGTGSWNEIFRPTEAGRVEATLYYSTDNVAFRSVSFFQVLCAEVSARYIYVTVTLTDPALDANIKLRELKMVAYEGPQ